MKQLYNPPAVLTAVIEENIAVQQAVLRECLPQIEQIAEALADALREGNKILLFGNGGSASDAQHVATEFVGRYLKNRRSLPALALTADSAVTSCIGNDFGYENIFARQVEGLAVPGDVVVGISTSGNSHNVLKGIEAGRAIGAVTIGFTGRNRRQAEGSDRPLLLRALAGDGARPGTHITVWHAICQMIDDAMP